MKLLFQGLLLLLAFAAPAAAVPGTREEPVRFEGPAIDPNTHDGRLKPAFGVHSHQIFRANRIDPSYGSAPGWTYNHAPDLMWWDGRFWVSWLTNPKDEHIAPGQTVLASSRDGQHWTTPVVVFPPYEPPPGTALAPGSTGYMMHQRVGFYLAPNGMLLALGFYAHAEHPFQEGGIGRVAREVRPDGTFGPIVFVKYETHAGWNAANTTYPFYTDIGDARLRDACEALLGDRLLRLQWRDEDDEGDPRYTVFPAGRRPEALSSYVRRDGTRVLLWKKSLAAISTDDALTFEPVKAPTLIMSGGKVWGQRTSDGRYSLTYNPIDSSVYRFPLAVADGDDGITFRRMLCVQGEVPPRRFSGRWKDFGPCYVRGLPENVPSPDGALWLVYSMNKEDIWISRVPIPLRDHVSSYAGDEFAEELPGTVPADWNTYGTLWTTAGLETSSDGSGQTVLKLEDRDPYDDAVATRLLPSVERGTLTLQFRLGTGEKGSLYLSLRDDQGRPRTELQITSEGALLQGGRPLPLPRLAPNAWHTVALELGLYPKGSYGLSLDSGFPLALKNAGESGPLTRLTLRTGPERTLPSRTTPNETDDPPLPGCDEPTPPFSAEIASVRLEQRP